jgi:effector-binding domain-containing protein
MRFLKITVFILVALLVVYCIIAAVTPSKVHVERSMLIQSTPDVPFNNINTLKNWKSWSYWDNIDPNMQSNYTGPESGVGAKHSWESKSDSVGKGSLTITKSEPNTWVETELWFDGMGTSIGGWKLADTAGMTKVTTYMDMSVPFFFRPLMAMMNMDAMLGADFDKSLNGLKTVSESAPKPLDGVSEMNTTPMNVVTSTDSCAPTPEAIKACLTKLYGKIGAYMGKNKLTQAGAPKAIYHVWAPEKTVIEAVIPVNETVTEKKDGDIHAYVMPETHVLYYKHLGPYTNMMDTYNKLESWFKTNNREMAGPPWEDYVTDPGMEKDSMKWETGIYWPLKAK